MRKKIQNKLRGARTRFFRLFQPRETDVKTVKYRGVHIAAPVHTDIGWRLYRDKSYEEAELSVLERFVRKDDVVIDVGANIGIYSLVLSRLAVDGRVVAVEPVPLNRAFLNLNLLLNAIDNVTVEDCILSDRVDHVDFSVSQDELYSSIIPTGRKATKERIRVRSTTLDALSQGGRIDVVKIDVEGAELMVLRGGEQLLSDKKRRPRAMLIELNSENQSVYGHTPDQIVDYLAGFGYTAHSFTEDGLIEGYTSDPEHEDVLFLRTPQVKPLLTSDDAEK